MPSRSFGPVIDRLAAMWEPAIRDEFFAALDDIKDAARIGAIAEALERGDVDRALELVDVDPVAFRRLENAIRDAYEAGGVGTVESLPPLRDAGGARATVRFDGRSVRAEQWAREHSSTLVTQIVQDQREAIRRAISDGLVAGRNPRSIALDIVGRIDPRTGRRIGGIVGLTAQQERYVASALEELTSGDPARLRDYLSRSRRDKRFDRLVLAAMKEGGKPLGADTIRKMIGRYADGLLLLRGETIGRTEAMAALNQAQIEAFRQAIDKGLVRYEDVRKVWVATHDLRTRPSHMRLHGESMMLDAKFANGLEYPCDPNGPASEVVNCRCRLNVRVDYLSNLE